KAPALGSSSTLLRDLIRRWAWPDGSREEPESVSTAPASQHLMKTVGWILAVLFGVALLLVPLMASRAQRWPACNGHVVMLRGPHGEPIECVCADGVMATCFSPGP